MEPFSPRTRGIYQIQARLGMKVPQNLVCKSVWGINGGVWTPWIKTGDKKILPWWERSTLVLITFFFFVLITLQRKCPCLLFLQRQIHWGRIYIRACSSIEDIVLWSLLLWDREINKYGVSGIVWQQNLFFSYLNDSMVLCLHTHAYYYISFFQCKSRQF